MLTGRSKTNLYLPAGRYAPRSTGVLGTRTRRQVAGSWPNLVLTEVCAVDLGRAITALSPEEIDLKQMLGGPAAVAKAVTGDKLARFATFAVVSGDRLNHLVAEAAAPSDVLPTLRFRQGALSKRTRLPEQRSNEVNIRERTYEVRCLT
jgi:hypothetical protein